VGSAFGKLPDSKSEPLLKSFFEKQIVKYAKSLMLMLDSPFACMIAYSFLPHLTNRVGRKQNPLQLTCHNAGSRLTFPRPVLTGLFWTLARQTSGLMPAQAMPPAPRPAPWLGWGAGCCAPIVPRICRGQHSSHYRFSPNSAPTLSPAKTRGSHTAKEQIHKVNPGIGSSWVPAALSTGRH
jgi:hypothetical protein